MKILVADDTEVMLALVSRFVESLGHTVIRVRDGREAVEAWQREQPDAILMDMVMPEMDGIEAARAIKAQSGTRWIPILFVSAVGEESRLADALVQGADDYLVKPVNFRILEAKLKAVERSVDLYHTVREQSAKLASYYDRAEEEKRVARHLMEQMVNAERLSDPQVHYWLNSAESLSGDLIAVARTPGRVLHVMLADGIGHGLTAALNVLPLTQPFYAMTEKGFSLVAILREMNAKVRQVLPFGRFVSLAMVAMDPVNGRIEVWNGGIPPLLLFDADGQLRRHFASQHVPLGILSNEEFDSETVSVGAKDGGSMALFSDGLIEAYNHEHAAFGMERVVAYLGGNHAAEALPALTGAFDAFMDGARNHDDISVVVVELRPLLSGGEMSSPRLADGFTLLPEQQERQWQISLVFGAGELRTLNIVPMLMGVLDQLPDLKSAQSEVFLILSELFNNALDHGLLRMDSTLKQEANGLELYLHERAARLQALQEGRIHVTLDGLRQHGRFVLCIEVIDSGPGFQYRELDVSPADVVSRHGRGIHLVYSLCQQVAYLGQGNHVRAYFVPNSAHGG